MNKENIKNELISEVEKLLNLSENKIGGSSGMGKLKAMAEREAKLKGQTINTQESKKKEFAEQSKKLFPDKENSGSNEKNSVKSLDNSNKKLIFAELEKDILEAVSKKFTESEWNNLTKEEQEEEIKCLKI